MTQGLPPGISNGAAPPHTPVGAILVAKHAFSARSEDELSFARHDRIQVLETDESFNDSWFLGKHLATDKVGLFPQTYMDKVPIYIPTNTDRPDASGPDGNEKSGASETVHDWPEKESISPNTLGPANPSQLPYPTSATPGSFTQMPHSPQYPPHSDLAETEPVGVSTSANTSSIDTEQTTLVSPNPIEANPPHFPVEPVSPLRPGSQAGLPAIPKSTRVISGPTIRTGRYSSTQLRPSVVTRSSAQNLESDSAVHRAIQDIDKHITHFRQSDRFPESSSSTHGHSNSVASSEYETFPAVAYIRGSETDDEEAEAIDELADISLTRIEPLTINVVSGWSADQVSRHLATLGVSLEACDVFRQQEISGDVLLTLDKETLLHPTLLNLGVIGIRLKIWNKICEFRDQLERNSSPHYSHSHHVSIDSRDFDDSFLRAGHDAVSAEFGSTHRPLSGSYIMPNPNGGYGLSRARRHSRLSHSSSNQNFNFIPSSVPVTPGHSHSRDHSYTQAHHRHSSFGSPSAGNRRSTAYSNSGYRPSNPDLHTSQISGYSKFRTSNSGQSSKLAEQSTLLEPGVAVLNGITRSDTVASSVYEQDDDQSITQVQSIEGSSTSVTAPNSSDQPNGGRTHATLVPLKSQGALSHLAKPTPLVTNLEELDSPAKSAAQSPKDSSWHIRIPGFRAFSDSNSQDKKASSGSKKAAAVAAAMPKDDDTSPSSSKRDSKSSSKLAVPSGSVNAAIAAVSAANEKYANAILPRRQNKKGTSAFVHGLFDKTPAEQMVDCDFSGWMMKRSTKLIGNWKSRLFILRGRRLSYYYSESDRSEKGLIDISGHKVLPATNERLVGFHASISHLPASHRRVSGETKQTGERASEEDNSVFVFKLVPPRPGGIAKSVNFTKPTVHYFAVNSIALGRSWMGALMRANIEVVESSTYSTFNHRTIPLKQAQAMNFRPPTMDAVSPVVKGREAEGDEEEELSGAGGAGENEKGDGTRPEAVWSGSISSSKVDSVASSGFGKAQPEKGATASEAQTSAMNS